MKQEQGTQINASGDNTRIIEGDQVEQQSVREQRVHAQHIGTMIVDRHRPLKTATLRPCPECSALNAPRARKCIACSHPIAAEHEWRAKQQRDLNSALALAIFCTFVAAAFLFWISDGPSQTTLATGPFRKVTDLAHQLTTVLALLIGIAPWASYMWKRLRHS